MKAETVGEKLTDVNTAGCWLQSQRLLFCRRYQEEDCLEINVFFDRVSLLNSYYYWMESPVS